MIRRCVAEDFELIYAIVNDGARAYVGVIPADRLDDRMSEPYMSRAQLAGEIADGVVFYGLAGDGVGGDGVAEDGELEGVMGCQQVQDVTLIRHAYVRTACQGRGVGRRLLEHLRVLTNRPVLIGTWADATWAIRFYERNGFRQVEPAEKDLLLRRYWKVPERQIETSVVLADERWREARGGGNSAAVSHRPGTVD